MKLKVKKPIAKNLHQCSLGFSGLQEKCLWTAGNVIKIDQNSQDERFTETSSCNQTTLQDEVCLVH